MFKVTQLQLFMLLTLYHITTAIAFLIGAILSISGYGAVLAIIGGSALGLIPAILSCKLAMRRPDRFFGEYGREILGKWLHYPLFSFLIIAMIFLATINVRELTDLLIQMYLPGTPAWAITMLCCICIGYAVRSGISAIFRAAEGIFFLTIAAFLLIPIIDYKDIALHKVIAIINHYNHPKELMGGSLYMFTLFGEMAFLVIVFPVLHTAAKTVRTLIWTTVASVIITFSHLIPLLFLFGPYASGILTYPDLELIRYLRTGTFVETLDPILIMLWMTSLVIKISFLVFLVTLALNHIFSIQESKPFSLTITAFIGVLSLVIVRSGPDMVSFVLYAIIPMLFLAEFVPSLYLVVDVIRFGKQPSNEHVQTLPDNNKM